MLKKDRLLPPKRRFVPEQPLPEAAGLTTGKWGNGQEDCHITLLPGAVAGEASQPFGATSRCARLI